MKWWIYIILYIVSQLTGALTGVALSALWPAHTVFNMIIALALSQALAIGLVYYFKPAWVPAPSDKTQQTLLALLMAPPIIVLVNLFLELLPELPNIHDETFLSQVMSHPFGIFCIAVMGPVSEELLFRAGILGGLLQRDSTRSNTTYISRRPLYAILWSAFIFSLAHLNPFQMPAAFILGIFLGWSYWRTGSLVAPCLIHILNNGLAVGLSLAFGDYEITLSQVLGGTTGVLVTIVVSVVWLGICLRAVAHQ